MNKREQKEFERLEILNLAMKGNTYREINKITGASLGYISNVLHKTAIEARDQIEQKWFLEIVPLQTKLSLLKLDEMDKIAWHIASDSKDERCKMQALSCLSVQDARRRDLLLSTEVIDRAISAQKSSLIAKEIDTIKQQDSRQTTDTNTQTGGNTTHTSEQQEEGSGSSENRVISDSDSSLHESGEPNNV